MCVKEIRNVYMYIITAFKIAVEEAKERERPFVL